MKCRCSSDDYLSLFCESSNGKEHARSRVPCWRSVRSENQEDWRPSCAKSKSRVRDQVTTRRQKAKITAPVRYPVVRHGPLRIANRLSSGEEISTKMPKDCCANTGYVALTCRDRNDRDVKRSVDWN